MKPLIPSLSRREYLAMSGAAGAGMVVARGQAEPAGYAKDEVDFEKLCGREDLDLIYIAFARATRPSIAPGPPPRERPSAKSSCSQRISA